MAHGLTTGERISAPFNTGLVLGGHLYQPALQGNRLLPFNAPCGSIPILPTKALLTGNPASNWQGIGATKLIPAQQRQLTVSSIENHQFGAGDTSLIASAGKDGFFGSVSDLKLGPVEKAVLHQAMYNQSKKQAPEMRRCDDCNVIFNSQTQAEMHYKGKKHAKVMYLKRSRESKAGLQKGRSFSFESINNTQLSTSPNTPLAETEDSAVFPHNDAQARAHSDSSLTVPGDISLNFNALQGRASVLPPTMQPQGEQGLLTINNEVPTVLPSNSDRSESTDVPTHSISPDNPLNMPIIERNCSPVETSPSKMSEELSPVEDDAKAKGLPQREPVVLPDPLPRYISRVEKPSVLKESLRCTVCDIYVNSENQMRQHVNSLRHKNIEKGIPTPPKPVKDDKPKGKAEQFRCEVCRVTLNSDIQLLQHLSSQRHKNMLEGKPPKPRWTPYERTQHALLRSAAQLRLSLKTIPSGGSPLLLTSPIPNSSAGLQVGGGHPALRPPLLASPAAGPTHMKQMAYIAPNGSILQTREVLYIGASAPQFPTTQQPQLSTPGGQILQSPFPGVHPELATVLNTPCVSLDPRDMAYSWNT